MPRVDVRRVDHGTVVFAPISEEPMAPSSSRFLDDDLAFEEAPVRLRPISLAVPPLSSREPREPAPPRSTVHLHVRDGVMRPPPPSARSLHLVSTEVVTPIAPHLAILAFAGFPDVPSSIFGAPSYALKVRARRKVLRAQLASARKRFSPDVELYERAISLADQRMVNIGMALVTLFCLVPVVVALAVLYC